MPPFFCLSKLNRKKRQNSEDRIQNKKTRHPASPLAMLDTERAKKLEIPGRKQNKPVSSRTEAEGKR
jgi:hypothetical protein